jgi:hypothetical protein
MRPIAALFTLCVTTLLCTSDASGQFDVYKTVEDFQNKTPKTYEGYEFHSQTGTVKDITIKLKNNATKERVDIDCSTIWGFGYKGRFFRVVKAGKYLKNDFENFYVMLVVDKGPFVWYRGEDLLREIHDEAKHLTSEIIITDFLSASIDSDFLAVPLRELGGKDAVWIKDSGKRFFVDNPELAWMDECVRRIDSKFKDQYISMSIRACVDTEGKLDRQVR